jgi:protein-tyrosine phosphatase
MSFVDLHLHLLPAVDDGPANLDESLRHARRLVEAGVSEVAVTPHVAHPVLGVDIWEIPERARRLQLALDDEGIPLRIHPGGEIYAGGALSLARDELELVAQGPPQGRWVLLETPFTGVDERFLDAAAHIRGQGFAIVIAHPERAARFAREGLRRLEPELTAGALLQVNACSLLGAHGPEAQEVARKLISSRLAYLIASDGHGDRRHQTLADGYAAALRLGATEVQAMQLTRANPQLLLRHGVPQLPAPRSRLVAR